MFILYYLIYALALLFISVFISAIIALNKGEDVDSEEVMDKYTMWSCIITLLIVIATYLIFE